LFDGALGVFQRADSAATTPTAPRKSSKADINRHTLCLHCGQELRASPISTVCRVVLPSDLVITGLIASGVNCDWRERRVLRACGQ